MSSLTQLGLSTMVAVFALLAWSGVASAHPKYVEVGTLNLKEILGTKSDWRVTTYEVAGGEDARFGKDPAKFCFWRTSPKTSTCRFTRRFESYGYALSFQTIGAPSIAHLTTAAPDRASVMIGASSSEGGSGVIDLASLWSYDPSVDDFAELFEFRHSELGESKIFDSGPMNGYLVTADFIRLSSEGETHFSEHRYSVAVWRYSLAESHYLQVLQYITDKKYGGRETTGAIDVITPELPQIQRLLKVIYPNDNVVR